MAFLFIRDLLFSFVTTTLLFGIPGLVIINWTKVKTSFIEKCSLSYAVGMIIMTWLWYVLSWLNLRLLLPFVLVAFLICFYLKRQTIVKNSESNDIPKWMIGILICMAAVFFIPYMASGDFGSFLSLVQVHYQDSPLHVSMINELVKQFPPIDPGFSGNYLRNYHFLYNLTASMVVWIFHLTSLTVHFRTMPLLFAFLWPFLTFILAKRLFKNIFPSALTTFLVMFGASFTPFIVWIYHIQLNFNSGMGILQPSGSLLNPPFASSVVVLLTSLYFLVRFEQTKNERLLFLLPFFFGMAVSYKVYAGIVGLAGFGIYTLLRLKRHTWKIAVSGLAAVGIALSVYWPFTGSSGFLVWAPLWVIHEIARASLPFIRYDNAIAEYAKLFDPTRTIVLEVKLLLYYIVGNFGLRILGFVGLVSWWKGERVSRIIIILFFTMFLVAFFIPLLFMQSLKPYEICQMFNYALLVLAFPTGYFIARTANSRSRLLTWIIVCLVVGFSIPEFVKADYPQYIVAPSKTVSSQEYLFMKRIRSERKKYDSIMVLPGSDTHEDMMGQWFRYHTNLILPAMTDTRSFLGFTNLIYSEDDVTKRGQLLKKIVDLNAALMITPSKDIVQTAQLSLDEVRTYHIRYIVSPEPLVGLQEQNLISFYGSTETTYIYVVRE